ncbi:hypothetical protein KVMX100_70073 [Klebsiella variicola]|nr:hypothetical protein KVMX100_70073 [Klebsiella variicola]
MAIGHGSLPQTGGYCKPGSAGDKWGESGYTV